MKWNPISRVATIYYLKMSNLVSKIRYAENLGCKAHIFKKAVQRKNSYGDPDIKLIKQIF